VTFRIALALLVIVPAAMAYPWQSETDRWLLGVAAGVLIVVFAWWRGQFVTTIIGRWLAMFRRNRSKPTAPDPNRVTAVLRVEDSSGVGVPLPLLAGYVERFGIRCEKVRVTSRSVGATRTTWISLTLDAVTNLAALQARSPDLPLYDITEITGRRLADHLRETGLDAVIVDDADAPLSAAVREKWSGVRDDAGFVSAYGIPIDSQLADRLAAVWSQPTETWTALEFSGTSERPTVAAVCAFRTDDAVRNPPVAGLIPHRGVQRPVLAALDPASADRLSVPVTALPADLLHRISWPIGTSAVVGDLSRT
jgi:type VII secretion protein EccE